MRLQRPGLAAPFVLLLSGIGIATAMSAQVFASPIGATARIHGLEWDLHEMTIRQVKMMAKTTGFVSRAERESGGYIYEYGWTQKKGWNWPADHLTFDEAQTICQFFGKRLPTDKEWTSAAYLEQRDNPPPGFVKGRRYTYPNGESAKASHCLNGCGNYKGTAPAGVLNRGVGAVPVMSTPAGVNGLFEMGGNVWEWVDTGRGDERITRSSSWWYDASRQQESDVATKPRDTRVGYIGFRCVRDPR
jgi:formylglycine-generating enzyme required for sulfatase activity